MTGATASTPEPVNLRQAARAVVAQAPELTQTQKDALRLAWHQPGQPAPERRAS